MRKIILSGYMGSGKTTVASVLHHSIGLPLIDLDNVIEIKTGQSVPEIFAAKGEIYFRRLEHQTLIEILSREASFVLALGGGTPCYANNHELLKKDGFDWIYLKTSPDTLVERLQDSTNRPLLEGKTTEDLKLFIGQHLFERSYFYNQAKYKVTTDGKSAAKIASEIEKLLA